MTPSRICTFCVMDDSMSGVVFDEAGQCNCCRDALARRAHEWWPNEVGEAKLLALVAALRREGKGKPYDAMVGLSGGIDSAYLAHYMRTRFDLRLLAVHVDGGWNSEAAVRNIELLVRNLDMDLHTYVVEWTEMRDMQLAFLKASVLNQDIPQDHAFFATLYRTAHRFQIKSFLSGVNFSSENISSPNIGFPSIDGVHVRGVHRTFGQTPLSSYPVMSLMEFLWQTRVVRQPAMYKPLNFIDYDKADAKQALTLSYGWKDYGGKHSESRFTKFYQDIYLPRRYGFDKRRLHLSSLIVSGQLIREAALAELETPILSEEQARRDLKFVAKKLQLTVSELNALIGSPPRAHTDFPNGSLLHGSLRRVRDLGRGVAGQLSGNQSVTS